MEGERRKAGSWVACVDMMRVVNDDGDDVYLRRKSQIDISLTSKIQRKRRAVFKTREG